MGQSVVAEVEMAVRQHSVVEVELCHAGEALPPPLDEPFGYIEIRLMFRFAAPTTWIHVPRHSAEVWLDSSFDWWL